MLFGQNHHKMYCDYVPTLPGEQNAHTRKICSEFQTKKERVSLFFNFFFFFFLHGTTEGFENVFKFFQGASHFNSVHCGAGCDSLLPV